MPHVSTQTTAIQLSWKTLFKIIAAIGLVWLWFQLYQIVLVLIVAIVLAVTLDPAVRALEQHRWPRWGASILVSGALLAVVGVFLWMTWSTLTTQMHQLVDNFGRAEQDLLKELPPWLRTKMKPPSGGDVTSYLAPYAVRLAESALSAVAYTALGFILMIYLLIEGRPTRDWLLAFVSTENRPKAQRTLDECERVIVAYAAGNGLTSLFAFCVAYSVLLALRVPAALLLAVLAGMADFVPVMGFLVSGIPAVLLASTVSPPTALLVAVAYGTYHAVENYFVGPWVYGDRLKLSNVAILVAFAVGAEIAGVIGALIALPVAAIYPTVERIWLREQVGETTVREHREIARKAG